MENSTKCYAHLSSAPIKHKFSWPLSNAKTIASTGWEEMQWLTIKKIGFGDAAGSPTL